MAEKIIWNAPTDTAITKVDIHSSATIYGTYSQVEEINATSDGEVKSSSNTWVTEYTDTAGVRTNWYKIRFYNGTTLAYSDFSEPTTAEELVRLCSVADIKKILSTTGRWTDDEIFNAITNADDNIYIESGTPISAMWSPIGKIDSTVQSKYYVGEENIYRIDRVFYGTTTKTELFLDDAYKANNKYGMISILPYASSGITISTDNEVEVQYVPRIYNTLCIYRTCQALLEQMCMVNGGKVTKEQEVIDRKLDSVETLLAQRVGLQMSSDVKYYDSIYGVNRKRLTQNHDRNNYMGNYGW